MNDLKIKDIINKGIKCPLQLRIEVAKYFKKHYNKYSIEVQTHIINRIFEIYRTTDKGRKKWIRFHFVDYMPDANTVSIIEILDSKCIML
jgi:hypothetical protein